MSPPPSLPLSERSAALEALFRERIVVLDGAMGSLLQTHGFTEADFRGERFAAHPRPLKGDNDLLCLTKPSVVEGVHRAYFDAGADVVETNSFNATSLSQADYGLEALAAELNQAAAACALRAARAAEAATPGRRCFVAGAVGPLNRTLSLSPDVNRPEHRAVSWLQVLDTYRTQVRALLEAGVDALLVETIFDTLNAKAALFAIDELFEARGLRVPVMLSVTITDRSGRTLTGQTLQAFWASVRHARPFSVGLNCAFGGRDMRPSVAELAHLADCFVSCYPNAGLPNALGEYDEGPDDMAAVLAEFAAAGWVNMVGGCCGSTPAHIAAIARAVRPFAPRTLPPPAPPTLWLSGLESLRIAAREATP